MITKLHKALHRHRNDLELLAMVSVVMLAIAGYLAEEIGNARQEGASWRRIDTEAVRTLIDAGDLSDREALWYHRSPPPGERRRAGP